jgi:hypothetical protein
MFLMAFGAGAGVRRLDPGQQPHERRFSGAVGADERQAIAAFDQ